MDCKKTACFILCLAYLLPAGPGSAHGASYRVEQAKLIRVEVAGPHELRTMVETFLTEKGFALVDDNQVPSLAVMGNRQVIGPPRDCKVAYHLTRTALRLPGGGPEYVFSTPSAYDYGPEDQASASALYLLRAHLNQDEPLLARLEEIRPAAYYDLQLSADPGDRKIDALMEKVTQISLALTPAVKTSSTVEPSAADRLNWQALATEQAAIRRQIAELAEKMQAGQAAASEEAFLRLAEKIEAAASRPEPQTPPRTCEDDGQRDYGRIGAVLIRVPVTGNQRLVTGDYTLCDESGKCVYQRTNNHVGIRVVGSMTRLMGSSAGIHFESRKNYLDIDARRYDPAQGAVIVSDCDAQSIRKLGRANTQVFEKGRIFIVPLKADRQAAE